MIRICCFLVIFFFSALNSISSAQSKSELEKRRGNIMKEINETEEMLNNTKKNRSESLKRLNLLDKKITLRNSIIENLILQNSEVDKRLEELEGTTKNLNADVT